MMLDYITTLFFHFISAAWHTITHMHNFSILKSIFDKLPDYTLAIIAIYTLNTWKNEIKTKRNQDILDKFQIISYETIRKIDSFVFRMEIAHSELESFKEHHINDPSENRDKCSGLCEFLIKRGSDYSKSLQKIRHELPQENLFVLHSRIQALDIKGKEKLVESYLNIVWCMNKIDQAISIFELRNLNLKNNVVMETATNIENISPQEIRNVLSRTYDKLQDFEKNSVF